MTPGPPASQVGTDESSLSDVDEGDRVVATAERDAGGVLVGARVLVQPQDSGPTYRHVVGVVVEAGDGWAAILDRPLASIGPVLCVDTARKPGSMQKTAKDIMQSQVVTVSPDAPLHSTQRLFYEEGIHGAPVVDEQGRVASIHVVLVGEIPEAARILVCREDGFEFLR